MELHDTTATEVAKALWTEQHLSGGASSLALNLVVIVDEAEAAEAESALTLATQQHPCRLLIVVRRDTDASTPRLDAEVIVGGRLGPCEAVVMRVFGPLAQHAESVVMPLLAPDVPVVTCWLVDPPRCAADEPLGALADRRITYSALSDDPIAALTTRAADYAPGDTDMCWTRITYWRSLVASAFDTATDPAAAVTITASRTEPSARLMAGWLGGRLGVRPSIEHTDDVVPDSDHLPSIKSVTISLSGGDEIAITRDNDGEVLLRRTGFPDRVQTIHGRTLGALLAEELRHMDADQPFEAALRNFADVGGKA